MYHINKELSKKILTVGPDYKNHRGGIGAIIGSYSKIYEDFKFVPTFRPYKSNLTKALFFVKQLFVVIKVLATDRDIRIVHMHGSHKGSFFRKLAIFWISKRMFNKKIIYHLNSSSYDIFYDGGNGITKRLVRHLMKNVDVLVCVSPWWENFYSYNFDLKQALIINNITDEPKARTSAKNNKEMNFLFLGRIGDRKGIFDLIDVIIKEKENLQGNFKLLIGGDGEVDKLNRIIKNNSLEQVVEYIGWVDAKVKEDYLLNADVYILPSYNEGLPISILEAMSYGLPIVSTYVGGTPDVLKNNENGFIFEPGDKTAMEEAIKSLLLNKSEALSFGELSLKKVQPYLPKSVAGQLTKLYNELL